MKIWNIIALCASSILAQSAFADGSTIGVAQQVKVTNDGAHTFTVFNSSDIDYFGRPACATSLSFAILDEESTAGRSQLALVILSKAIREYGIGNIWVRGTGTCTRVEDAEDVASIEKL